MRDTTEGFIYGILVMTVLYMFGYYTGQYWLYVMIVCLILIFGIIDHVYQKDKSEPYPFLLEECIHTDADRCFRAGWQAGHIDGKERMHGAAFVFFCMGVILILTLW
jgi:hypothetical protein